MQPVRIVVLLILVLLAPELKSQVVLQRCDRTNLWSGSNTLLVDNVDKMEGIASIRFTGSGINWFSKSFSQVHTGVNESGYLRLWLYISDVASFTGDGQIEITSSGGPDSDEYSWDLGSLSLRNGWNELLLPLSTAAKTGSPDLNAINFFRVYQELISPITAKIDDIRFLKTGANEPSDDPLDIKPLDFNTLDGKVMFGYQGWFLHPDDGSAYARWRHWGRNKTFSPENITVDMFPDFREYEADELYPTNGFTYADGREAKVYSAYTKKTVVRHMKWIRDYGLDGVFLQRFVSNVIAADNLRRARDTVTANIMDGCEKYGRAFANMWDISGFDPGKMDLIINDWKHLVDDLKITESPSYLHHRGRPLVSIWGFTVREEFPESDLQILLDFFKSESTPEKYRATVMLGVDHDFHERPAWLDELSQADVISPWAVGRFGNDEGQQNFMNNHVLPGQDWCDQRNVDFLPVIWPGFSWANLKYDVPNKRPRRGGNFFWTQATRVISGNAKSIYIAMFDEVDESTAMFKLAENDSQTPDQAYWLALDADGYDLPSDWYLRCAKQATEIVRGKKDNQTSLGSPPDGIDAFSVVPIAARCGADNGALELHHPMTEPDRQYEFSIDNGLSYTHTTLPGKTMITVEGLTTGIYHVWVRNEDDSYPTDLGPYTIFDAEPEARVSAISATCDEGGGIRYVLNDLPYAGEVQISVDGGANYNYTSQRNIWSDTITELSLGYYLVWIRYEDGTCEAWVDSLTIMSNLIPVEMIPMLDGVQGAPITDTLYTCPGSSFLLFCSPMDSDFNWTISGPAGFTADTRTFQVSGALSPEMFGTYDISYTRPDGCTIPAKFELVQDAVCETNAGIGLQFVPYVEMYPNPAAESVLIHTYAKTRLLLAITDMSGRILKTGIRIEPGATRVDMTKFASGLYYFIFSDTEGNRFNHRLIKAGRS